jgi:hypothetical protein
VTQPARAGTFAIEPLEAASLRPHAVVVTTARYRYWFESRREPGRDEQGRVTAPAGLLAYVESNPDQWLEDQISTLTHILIADPVGRGTPPLLPGDRFGEAGAFQITPLRPADGRAQLAFRWTDRTAPPTPAAVARKRGDRLRLEWREAGDPGSGLARYELSVDRGAPISLTYRLGLTAATIPRPAPGAHVVRLVAVDRAGNRSAPAVVKISSRP